MMQKMSLYGRLMLKFTLIELLVVITIIAILAAMLMPALERARQMAVRSECLSRQRQMFLGISMYANNYDGRYPYSGLSNAHTAFSLGGVATEEMKYMIAEAEDVFWCPGVDWTLSRGQSNDSPVPRFPADTNRHLGYTLVAGKAYLHANNFWWHAPMRDYRGGVRLMLSDMVLAHRPAFGEERFYTHGDMPGAVYDGHVVTYGDPAGANGVYTDGHAAWSDIDDLLGMNYKTQKDMYIPLGSGDRLDPTRAMNLPEPRDQEIARRDAYCSWQTAYPWPF